MYPNLQVSIFILKTIYFILQNMFRSLHTSSSVVHIKSTVNIQIIRVCYSIIKIQFKNFYLAIFIPLNTNILNKTIKTFTLAIKKIYLKNIIFKNIPFLKHLKWRTIINRNVTEGNRANKGQVRWTKK